MRELFDGELEKTSLHLCSCSWQDRKTERNKAIERKPQRFQRRKQKKKDEAFINSFGTNEVVRGVVVMDGTAKKE